VSDRIVLRGLATRGRHGVLPQERLDGQDFVVDVALELDVAAAAATDDLARTVHYGELAQALADVVRGEPVDLIETLAERLARVCVADPRVEAAEVTVHKPAAPIPERFADVAVTLRRTRAEISPVVETDPVGGPEQPEYLNAVVAVRSTLTPHALLAACLAVEQRHGRERRVRWAARTLDVDVVTYGDLVLRTPDLVLPHPRAATRAFVLAPWAELDPSARLAVPGGSVPVLELLADLVGGSGNLGPDVLASVPGVRRRPDVHLEVPA
jgi:dihydroneopterin aldolase/2-amino-4-hydroxy-6-hydroxymethyldihydropteridine diphosphokinase